MVTRAQYRSVHVLSASAKVLLPPTDQKHSFEVI